MRPSLLLTVTLILIPATPAVSADSLRVLSQNMNRMFDDVDDGNREQRLSNRRFHQRVGAAAKMFGEFFGLPQVIALQEVENLNVLNRIAKRIERAYGVRYRPVLMPGQDVSGINLAFLVRHGIDSISLTPDRVIETTLTVLDLEKSLQRSPRNAG